MADRAYDTNRLKLLFHYVIWAAGARPHFGATKLYKVSWFSDARRFVLKGQSITGAPYIREKHGPVPRDGMLLREEMVQEGAILQWKDRLYDYEVWRFKAVKPPEAGALDADDKLLINYWVKHVDEDHTATSISDESHNYAWEIARMGERIPFASFLSDRIREPNEEELDWAKRKAAALGLI